jgi:uncharacterized delta-60 repeat protein
MAGYDLTFDTDGRAITDLGSISDRTLQLVSAANGKILAEGINSSNIIIAQYNPDGSLDTGFGVGGKLDTGLKGFTTTGGSGSITTTSTGKIVIAGADANGISVVARFLANGQLDTSFGTNGRYSTQNTDAIITTVTSLNIVDGSEGVIFTQENISPGNKYDVFTSLDANGQIIPLALNGNTSAIPLKLDLNILNGVLASATINNADPNVQGVLSILGQPLINSLRSQYAASNFTINGIRAGILGDGSIIVNFFGYQNPVALSGFVSFESHLKLDGTFDLNYGTNGLAALPFPADYRGIADFGIDNADRIVLAIYNSATDDISVYRLNTSGQADATFGTNGKLTLPGAAGTPDSIVVEVDSQNRVLVNVKKTADNIFNVTRVNSNGTIDNTFGTSGKLQLPTEANSRLSTSAVLLGADNRLFVGGATNGDILVAKYDISENFTTYAVTVDKTSLIEGNSGNTPVVFTITRSGNTSGATSINYALAGTATNTTDYNIDTIGGGIGGTGITGTVNFAANETTKTLKINVSGDVLVEPDETVLLTLSNPSVTTPSSSITTATATTTIQNDDGLNQVPTITSATFDTFTSTLVVSGTGFLALAGANNDINVSNLSFTGEGGKSYTLTSNNVEITSDTSFSVVLSVADDTAIDQLINKAGTTSIGGTTYNLAAAEGWAAGADPSLKVADLTNNVITANLTSSGISIDSPSITEGNSGTKDLIFTVTGFANNIGAVTASLGGSVDYTTVNGTATAGSDYVATSGTLTFAFGEISKTITVKVNGDNNFEPNETFTIKLSNNIGNVIANDTGTGTIINDDTPVPGSSNTLRFTKISHLAQNRNELGVFTIDDAQGTVNSIAPSQTGYLAEVLKRSQVVFSALGESAVDLQLDNQASRYLDLPAGQQLGYYLVQNGSTSDLNAGAKPPIFFAFPSNDSGLANAKFTQNGTVSQLAFEDTPGGDKDFNDLVVQIENATFPAPLGTAQQGNKNIFDLTSVVNTTSVQTSFEVKRDASYNNHIGFYKIEDAQGSILAGTALIKPGEAGYREAIVQGRIAGIDLIGTNGQTVASNGSFQGGALYAPFLIVNSSSNNADFSNIFTAYSLGNADKVEHVRLLGDNTFGFEDLFGGGDRDYNDVIIKATFASIPGDFSQG